MRHCPCDELWSFVGNKDNKEKRENHIGAI
jgi:hypothetical protein